MKKQECKHCETVFLDKLFIDFCPVCRGKEFVRKDDIEYFDYELGKYKTEEVEL